MTLEEIRRTAMTLPERDRLTLAMDLMETIPDDHPGLSGDDRTFVEELNRRVNAGGSRIPWEIVEKELEAGLNP